VLAKIYFELTHGRHDANFIRRCVTAGFGAITPALVGAGSSKGEERPAK
jgi:hypothetical protein